MNKKVTFFCFFILFMLIGCKSNLDIKGKNKRAETSSAVKDTECKGHISRYKSVGDKELLYLDKKGRLNVKLKVKPIEWSNRPLTNCQKLPYGFLDHLLYEGDIIFLEDVVDVDTFEKIDLSSNFYRDKNFVYVYQDSPVTYPALSIINVSSRYAKIINDTYIKDNDNVYYLGVHVSNNAERFKYIPNSNGMDVFEDGEKVIFNWREMEVEEIKTFGFSQKVKSRLLRQYKSNAKK